MSFLRPETQHRGSAPHSESDIPEQEEEILGSDDDEQEDPNDYCKGVRGRCGAVLLVVPACHCQCSSDAACLLCLCL